MLEVNDLHVYYGGIHALKGVLRSIVGLAKPRRGSIRFQDVDVSRKETHQIIRMGIGISPEGRKVFANLTVMENLELGAYNRTHRDFVDQLEWVFSLFPRLKEREQQLAGTLSGGEQQMLALGRALMSRPRLVLLDEPSLGLAPLVVHEVFRTIQAINERGATILLVEQNAIAALQIAHYGYVLETGEVMLEGTGESLLRDERVRQAYLGD